MLNHTDLTSRMNLERIPPQDPSCITLIDRHKFARCTLWLTVWLLSLLHNDTYPLAHDDYFNNSYCRLFVANLTSGVSLKC